MLATLGRALFRARWFVLVAGLVVVLGAALFGSGLFPLLKAGGFEDPNSQSAQAQDLLDRQLGGSSSDVVILMRSDTLAATDPAFAGAAEQLLDPLRSRPEVASVTSYYSTHSPRFLSRDGHATFALVQLASSDETVKGEQYKALLPYLTSSSLQVSVGGTQAVNAAVNAQVSADLERAEMITFPVVGILLFLVFAGLVAAGLPLLIGGIAILGAFAILRLLTGVTDISIFAINVVTVLGLGLAIDYSLFIVTRYREELAASNGAIRRALERTLATAGRTVLFSGLTVSVSLLGLLLFPEGFLRSMGLGAIGAVLVAMLSALTILPALLAVLGRRVNALSIQRLFPRSAPAGRTGEARGAWYRLSHFVMRFPIPVALLALAVLVTLGLPFLRASFSTPDVRVLPAGQEARVVSERLSQDFANQGSSEIVIAIRTPGNALSPANLAALQTYVGQIASLPNVLEVQSLVTVDPRLTLADYQRLYTQPSANPQLAGVAAQLAHGDATKVVVELRPAEFSPATETATRQIRALPAPDGLRPLVAGETAYQMDLFSNLRATLPYALLVIALAICALLFLMTGSVVMPLKAIVLNTLSLSATFGALVWIFQDGHFEQLLAFQSNGSIDGTQTILIFALAFGLSMDYEIFLLSRIKEQFDATGDNRAAVATGLQRTGWLISSAALLLAVVLAALSTSHIVFIQQIGLGLAIAVIMDATLVRGLLVPATMRLLGRWNWWAPAPLRALWQRVGLSETEDADSAARSDASDGHDPVSELAEPSRA
ncbi:MAG TPA: MMPL family transporter [Ktedonobacterales bacterium]|jgi:RND superfamily putative drug exporter|nr:MMPL family transporter [Ktedonobacterales bacterium]